MPARNTNLTTDRSSRFDTGNEEKSGRTGSPCAKGWVDCAIARYSKHSTVCIVALVCYVMLRSFPNLTAASNNFLHEMGFVCQRDVHPIPLSEGMCAMPGWIRRHSFKRNRQHHRRCYFHHLHHLHLSASSSASSMLLSAESLTALLLSTSWLVQRYAKCNKLEPDRTR